MDGHDKVPEESSRSKLPAYKAERLLPNISAVKFYSSQHFQSKPSEAYSKSDCLSKSTNILDIATKGLPGVLTKRKEVNKQPEGEPATKKHKNNAENVINVIKGKEEEKMVYNLGLYQEPKFSLLQKGKLTRDVFRIWTFLKSLHHTS